jgi:hypothetical protein
VRKTRRPQGLCLAVIESPRVLYLNIESLKLSRSVGFVIKERSLLCWLPVGLFMTATRLLTMQTTVF